METGSSSSGWAFLILCSNPRGLGVGGGGTLLLLESCGPSVTINASASKQGLLWRPGSSPPPCSASLLHGTRTLTQPASSRQPHPGLTTSPPPHGAPPRLTQRLLAHFSPSGQIPSPQLSAAHPPCWVPAPAMWSLWPRRPHSLDPPPGLCDA